MEERWGGGATWYSNQTHPWEATSCLSPTWERRVPNHGAHAAWTMFYFKGPCPLPMSQNPCLALALRGAVCITSPCSFLGRHGGGGQVGRQIILPHHDGETHVAENMCPIGGKPKLIWEVKEGFWEAATLTRRQTRRTGVSQKKGVESAFPAAQQQQPVRSLQARESMSCWRS